MAQPMTAAQAAQAAQRNNELIKTLILSRSVVNTQQIYGNTFDPRNNNNVINVQPRAVGLLMGFFLEITAVTNNSDGALTATLTPWGPANLIQQIIFYDLANQLRHNTTGWHLFSISTAKRHRVWGAAYTTDSPVQFKNNSSVISADATIAHGAAGAIKITFYVPIMYGPKDFRGAIYLGVVQSTAQLQITFNNSAFVAAAADPTNAIYQGAPGNISSITLNVYQRYYDQLPQGRNGVVLPLIDMSTVYLLQNSPLPSGIVANMDYPIPFANFRSFLSATVNFDNQTGGSYPAWGSDVAYWALQSANFTNIFKMSPKMVTLETRGRIGCDFPQPAYYFDFRDMPINSIQYGNMSLVLNASTVNAGAYCNVGWEMFALVDQIVGAGSLPPA